MRKTSGSTPPDPTRTALTAATNRCYQLGAQYRATDDAGRAALAPAMQQAATNQRAALTNHRANGR